MSLLVLQNAVRCFLCISSCRYSSSRQCVQPRVMYFHVYFNTQFSALVMLTTARGQTLCLAGIQRSPSVRRGLSESTGPYGDGEGRQPIIAAIAPFIFCFRQQGNSGANEIALCNNLQRWINRTNFTGTDRCFASSSPVPFLFCSRPSAGVLISVIKYLIVPHRGNKKEKAWRLSHLSGNHRNMSTTSSMVKSTT